MGKIIITDLTRFNNPDTVCTAGTDMQSRRCLRPMPYLRTEDCVRLGILPGAILSGEFSLKTGLVGPHQEDATYSNLAFEGPSTSDEFRSALEAGLYDSVETGFQLKLIDGQKHIPINHALGRSIITLAVDPKSIEIVEDTFKPGKVKIHFTDGSARRFRFLAITDLGFHRYADTHRAANDLAHLNDFIRKQSKAYLRVGLSRPYEAKGINGYWMQVNGIYTFPNFFEEIRSYK